MHLMINRRKCKLIISALWQHWFNRSDAFEISGNLRSEFLLLSGKLASSFWQCQEEWLLIGSTLTDCYVQVSLLWTPLLFAMHLFGRFWSIVVHFTSVWRSSEDTNAKSACSEDFSVCFMEITVFLRNEWCLLQIIDETKRKIFCLRYDQILITFCKVTYQLHHHQEDSLCARRTTRRSHSVFFA